MKITVEPQIIKRIRKTRILFFIGSLQAGGKERRFIELLTYLKKKDVYELMVVIVYNHVDYPIFYELGIKHVILNKKPDFKDPRFIFKMHSICKKFNPDVIHTWGSMQTFYMIPTSLVRGVPIINSQITSAPPNNKIAGFSGFINTLNFHHSKYVISNSKAGLKSYEFQENDKYQVIYNGINLERFKNLTGKEQIRKTIGIWTKYAVVMVASFTDNKDYDKFLEISQFVGNLRDDITFLAVGSGKNLKVIKEKTKRQAINNVLFLGKITNVEEVVAACDIGVLLSNKEIHGEGISNAIMEYMALGKPVIANDTGGTGEILRHNESGFLVSNETVEEISSLLLHLIDNPANRQIFGQRGKEIIENHYSLDKMGKAFEKLYIKCIKSD